MKTQDFFQMSKKYIFKTCLKCGKNQDSKFTMNYELVVNIDFREDEIYITNKQKEYLYEIKYTDIISIDFMICPRYTSRTKIARSDYNIAYTIHMNNQSFYFESMSYLIWNDILMLLNRKGILINDPLNLCEAISNVKTAENFYAYCEQNIGYWKKEFQVIDPKLNNLIVK